MFKSFKDRSFTFYYLKMLSIEFYGYMLYLYYRYIEGLNINDVVRIWFISDNKYLRHICEPVFVDKIRTAVEYPDIINLSIAIWDIKTIDVFIRRVEALLNSPLLTHRSKAIILSNIECKYNIIDMSECWVKDDKNISCCIELPGYVNGYWIHFNLYSTGDFKQNINAVGYMLYLIRQYVDVKNKRP